MASIQTTLFTSQPQTPVAINKASPVARGIVSVLSVGPSLVHDAVDGSAWSITQSGPLIDVSVGTNGRGLHTGGSRTAYLSRVQPASVSNSATQPITLRFRLVVRSFPTNGVTGAVLSWASAPDSSAPRYYARLVGTGVLGSPTGSIEFYYSTSGGVYRTPTVLQAGTEYIITHTFDGTTHCVYVNGVYVGGYTGPWTLDGGKFLIGNGYNAPAGDYLVSDVAIWSRALSSGETQADATNPYQIFKRSTPSITELIALAAPAGRSQSLVFGVGESSSHGFTLSKTSAPAGRSQALNFAITETESIAASLSKTSAPLQISAANVANGSCSSGTISTASITTVTGKVYVISARGTFTSMPTNLGITWTQFGTTGLWYGVCTAGATGTLSFGYTSASGGTDWYVLDAFTNVDTTTPFVQVVRKSGTGPATLTDPLAAFSNTGNGTYAVAGVNGAASADPHAFTAGSGYTLLTSRDSVASVSYASEFKAANDTSPSFTSANSSDGDVYYMWAGELKAASAVATGRQQSLSFNYGESSSHGFNLSVLRGKILSFAVNEAESITAVLGKSKALNFGLAEIEAVNTAVARARKESFGISELGSYAVSFSKVKSLGLSLSEAFALNAAVIENKSFGFLANEISTNGASLTVLRKDATFYSTITGIGYGQPGTSFTSVVGRFYVMYGADAAVTGVSGAGVTWGRYGTTNLWCGFATTAVTGAVVVTGGASARWVAGFDGVSKSSPILQSKAVTGNISVTLNSALSNANNACLAYSYAPSNASYSATWTSTGTILDQVSGSSGFSNAISAEAYRIGQNSMVFSCTNSGNIGTATWKAEAFELQAASSTLKSFALTNSAAEAFLFNATRGRTVNSAVTSAQIASFALNRQKQISANIAEVAAYTLATLSVRNTKFAFTQAAAENVVTNLSLSKKFSLSQSEVSTIATIALQRAKKIALAPITESAVVSGSVGRARNVGSMSVNEVSALNASLGRLKTAIFGFAEVSGMSVANVIKIKSMVFGLGENETITVGPLSRLKKITLALNEISNIIFESQGGKSFAMTMNEASAINVVVKRMLAVRAVIAEIDTKSVSVSRKQMISTAINEISSATARLAKLKMLAAMLNAGATQAYAMNRVRNVNGTLAEINTITADIRRARKCILPAVAGASTMSINVGRMQRLVTAIAEHQSYSVALGRVRGLLTELAEQSGITFNLSVHTADPDAFLITVTWQEFVNVNGALTLTDFSANMKVATAVKNVIYLVDDATVEIIGPPPQDTNVLRYNITS